MTTSSSGAERTGGELLVACLESRDVDTVFALPGIQLDGLFDALARTDGIRVIHTRHEQGAAYMADGYARATGRVGVCIVVPGPGVLNAGAGLATAYATGSPVLCVAGNLFGGEAAKGTGALHEIPDQSAVLRGTIGFTAPIGEAADIGPALDRAFDRLGSLPRRPAAIEIGPATLVTATDLPLPTPSPSPERPTSDPAAVEEAAERLAGCRRPVIIAGGGSMEAGDEIIELAESLGAPIVVSPSGSGKGAVDADRADVLPPVSVYQLLPDCDGLVVIGSRFTTTAGRPPVSPETVVVRIDADPARLDRFATVNLHADAADAARRLAEAVRTVRPVDEERDHLNAARVAELRGAIDAGLAEQFPDTWGYCQALRDVMDDDDVLVDEMTQVGYMARHAYRSRRPRTYLGSGYQGTLGFGYPTSLGVKVGRPEQAVVSISGDGGFLFGASELATAAHHDIPVVAVVFSDDAYGNVKGIQQRTYGREIASTLTNPDFVALATSYGIKAERATDADGLRASLATAIGGGQPALIEVPIPAQPDLISVLNGRRSL